MTPQQMQDAVRNGIIRASFLILGANVVSLVVSIVAYAACALMLRTKRDAEVIAAGVAVCAFLLSFWVTLWNLSAAQETSLREEVLRELEEERRRT